MTFHRIDRSQQYNISFERNGAKYYMSGTETGVKAVPVSGF